MQKYTALAIENKRQVSESRMQSLVRTITACLILTRSISTSRTVRQGSSDFNRPLLDRQIAFVSLLSNQLMARQRKVRDLSARAMTLSIPLAHGARVKAITVLTRVYSLAGGIWLRLAFSRANDRDRTNHDTPIRQRCIAR